MGGSDAFAGTSYAGEKEGVSVATDEAQAAATGRYVGINGIEVCAFFLSLVPGNYELQPDCCLFAV